MFHSQSKGIFKSIATFLQLFFVIPSYARNDEKADD
jgi:hypothetical protein